MIVVTLSAGERIWSAADIARIAPTAEQIAALRDRLKAERPDA